MSTDPDEAARRRRIIPIVNPRFQWKYTLMMVGFGCGVTAVMGALLYKTYQENTRILEIPPQFKEQLLRGDQIFLLYLVITVLVMAIVLAGWGLIVTHRISGPLHIAARYLDDLAEGRYPDLRPLRKRDELRDFFYTLERAVSRMRDRDQTALEEIERALTEAGDGDESAARACLDRLRARLSESLERTPG